MTEETTITHKEGPGTVSSPDSTVAGVTVRAWLAVIFAATVAGSHLAVVLATLYNALATNSWQNVGSQTTIGEPLYTLAVGSVSYYFGSMARKTT